MQKKERRYSTEIVIDEWIHGLQGLFNTLNDRRVRFVAVHTVVQENVLSKEHEFHAEMRSMPIGKVTFSYDRANDRLTVKGDTEFGVDALYNWITNRAKVALNENIRAA